MRLNMRNYIINYLLNNGVEDERGNAPAIECAVVLAGFPAPIAGSLSKLEDSESLLKLMHPNDPKDPTKGLVENVFDANDVVCISVVRAIKLEPRSRIVG